MSKPSFDPTPPTIEGQRGVSWPVVLGLALLLPIVEWAGGKALRLSGIPVTTASLWATTLVVNGLFVVLLFGVSGRAIRRMWSMPGIKDIGLTLVAFVAGWMVIPLAQWAASQLFVTTSASDGGPGASLVPSTGLDMVLLALASIVGAISQETLYRGLLWERLQSSANRWVALIGSSLVFGLIYLSGGLSNYLSVGVAWGFVAGGLYFVTRRLTTVVLLNALNMFLTYAVLFRYML